MESIFKRIEEYALKYNVPIMQTEGITFLTQYIEEHNVTSILEIGSAIGYSALKMADIHSNIQIVTIERDLERYKEALKNIKLSNKDNQIKIILGDALEVDVEGQFDLIFIDAAKAQYIKFFERYAKNVKSDGVIVSDNLKFHGLVEHQDQIKNRNTKQLVRKIEKYNDYLKQHTEFETTFFDIGDGIALTKKR